MSSVNKVILVGNLGKDPEVRHLENGVSVATFPIATSESYTTKDGRRVEQTEWHNVVAWRGLADIAAKYLHKGRQVYVEGKLRTRSYDDKEGNKRYLTEIVAENLTLLGRKDNEFGYTNSDVANTPKIQDEIASIHNDAADDLPF
ncbi:single-stranded DNA-binding protein [Pedobacter sp. SYSU D00535]|uniref:single-stranded DNA-binding protein n=1 Tax=Pedobacter sp. SYSU D00535 TaxID=2810308 RepID=UPI001A975735|nr:single-stranded DNA-binding protein [Pedobacter sp. SYSU D00535]